MICYLRHVIGRIGPGAARVNPGHLSLVVVDEFYRLTSQVVQSGGFGKTGHVVVDVLFWNDEIVFSCRKVTFSRIFRFICN